ncbi:rho GTPase-activating protein 22-like isoform X1 [Excalfactoria chinensis]|uniref:rho GTPase-activating protein 22-like isoform X1 n=1 Tax=Excalfactoria chinensis TaxID=46218 RepID=UPI003B3BCB05
MIKTFQEHRIDTTECIKNLRQLISCLPKAHQNLLQFLSAFLLKVATYSAVNCMTLENLAIVFGPALFKIPVSPLACEEQRLYNGLLLYLLQHYEMLFVDVNPCFSARQADGLQKELHSLYFCKMSQSVWACGDMGKNFSGKILSSSLIKAQTKHSREAHSCSEWKTCGSEIHLKFAATFSSTWCQHCSPLAPELYLN